MKNEIIIKGAREHNLKNINTKIPKNQITIITGISGSGKSTLAFDTLYAEGQRRYVESLSAYARQFLGVMNKPEVDSIEGLSPAISIEQKTTSKNPRSTVGTVTEIYDYLRLLYARIGIPHCPKHNTIIQKKTPEQIGKTILKTYENQNITILSPQIRQKKGTYEKLAEELKNQGWSKIRVNKKIQETNKKLNLDRYKKHDIELIIDELNTKEKDRLMDSIQQALNKGNGLLIILKNGYEQIYSQEMSCLKCGTIFEELEPRMFSFNSPFGACDNCQGIGYKQKITTEFIIPNINESIADGAIKPYRNAINGFRAKQVAHVAKEYKFSIFDPIKILNKKQLNTLLYGSDKKIRFNFETEESQFNFTNYWEGIIPNLERLYKETKSDYRRKEIERYMTSEPCVTCEGNRLKKKTLAITIQKKNIIELTKLSIKNCLTFFNKLEISEKEYKIVKQVLKEIRERLTFLNNVGLNYLNLSRNAGTLSGGEAQRIRLATQIGSNLTGVLYVLDEPSIGLHQKDNKRLIQTLKNLKNLGNTLVVVEHDEDTINSADHVIDLGPGAGIHGGHIVSQGTPEEIRNDPKSLTGKYLKGEKKIKTPISRRKSNRYITIRGAKRHNLKNLELKIPLNVLTLITGVSGSGKSTLMYEILYKALKKELYNSREIVKDLDSIIIPKEIKKTIMINQSPIGKTPRSNPATYTKVFDEIRTLFSQTKESKLRGYKPGRFSFNVEGGRCEECKGDGLIRIEMHFLPDVYITCDDCKGTRYNEETLEVKYKNKNINKILEMSVEEALNFFQNIPNIHRKIEKLNQVGLGYIKLGQSSTTLSGGEAQRIKITKELGKKITGDTIYLLDEPTTGLHFEDVNRLIKILQELVNRQNTVIVIEHNLDVIKNADHIIDLGPEGGENGGEIIVEGSPEQITENEHSYTVRYLNNVLRKEKDNI